MGVTTSNTTTLGVLGMQDAYMSNNQIKELNNYMSDSQIRELKRSIDQQRYLYDQMNREAQMMKSRCDEVIQPKSTPNKLLLLCEV